MDYLDILYSLRNEYAHIGITSGSIFAQKVRAEEVENFEQITDVIYYDKERGAREIAFSVSVSYDEFLRVYSRDT